MRSMMKMFNVGGAIVVGLAVFCWGCTAVSNDTALQQLTGTNDLASVSVSDGAKAIQDYTGQGAALPFGEALTADQEAQLSALQDQHDAGQITDQQYAEQLAAIIGVPDAAPPFGPEPPGGGPGGPMGPGGPGPGDPGPGDPGPGGPDSQLNLTTDQQTQAQAIFDNMRQDILALQEATKTQIDAVLTDDQRAQLNSFDRGSPDGFRHFGPGLDTNQLSEDLGLTADQQSQIQSLLDSLQTAVEARRQQAQHEFRAILTADQQAILDQFEADHPAP